VTQKGVVCRGRKGRKGRTKRETRNHLSPLPLKLDFEARSRLFPSYSLQYGRKQGFIFLVSQFRSCKKYDFISLLSPQFFNTSLIKLKILFLSWIFRRKMLRRAVWILYLPYSKTRKLNHRHHMLSPSIRSETRLLHLHCPFAQATLVGIRMFKYNLKARIQSFRLVQKLMSL